MNAVLRLSVIGTFAVLVSAATAPGAQLYLETFPTSANNTPVNTVDWFSFRTASATSTSAVTSSNAGIVLSAGAGVNGDPGLAFASATGGSPITLFGTEEPGVIAQADLQSISFYLRQFTAGGGRVSVRIDSLGTPGDTTDDAWYATDTLYAEAGAAFVQQSFAFTTAAAEWRDVTLVPGSQLEIAGVARTNDLPTGDVTAFGMLFDGSTNGIRMDNYEIIGVPEPGALMLAGMGLLALAVGRAWKRR